MRMCSIASGSSGNCIYIGSEQAHMLVDIGISGKKMEQKVMSAVPFFLLGYMKLTAWDFICPLYGNLAGVLMMSISLMVYIGADYIAGKIVEIEV